MKIMVQWTGTVYFRVQQFSISLNANCICTSL